MCISPKFSQDCQKTAALSSGIAVDGRVHSIKHMQFPGKMLVRAEKKKSYRIFLLSGLFLTGFLSRALFHAQRRA